MPLSVCAEVRRGMEKRRMADKMEEGNAIGDVVRMAGGLEVDGKEWR